jgi:hypothetical protein
MFPSFATGVVDFAIGINNKTAVPVAKFAAGVVDTGGKFASGVADTCCAI